MINYSLFGEDEGIPIRRDPLSRGKVHGSMYRVLLDLLEFGVLTFLPQSLNSKELSRSTSVPHQDPHSHRPPRGAIK